jgi:hypothetical protein
MLYLRRSRGNYWKYRSDLRLRIVRRVLFGQWPRGLRRPGLVAWIGLLRRRLGIECSFGTPAHVELDVYTGITRPTASGLGWDLGLAYYTYPGASQTNYGEAYGGVTYKALTAKLWYANDYAGTGGDGVYLEGETKLNLPRSVGLTLHTEYSAFDPQVGVEDYGDYKASRAARGTAHRSAWPSQDRQHRA